MKSRNSHVKKKRDNYLQVLRNEFEGGKGSFLIQIRPSCNWNKASFTRLITAMQRCCEKFSHRKTLERWMANGFWYLSFFVRDWTTHPNFPQVHEPEYYKKAYQRLDDLAYWFFFGESPYLPGKEFEPL